MNDQKTKAAQDVLKERARQQSQEGYTPEKDDGYGMGQLHLAAQSYLGCCAWRDRNFMHKTAILQNVPSTWPWPQFSWKPKNQRQDLVRAAALIIAEIERLDRKGGHDD